MIRATFRSRELAEHARMELIKLEPALPHIRIEPFAGFAAASQGVRIAGVVLATVVTLLASILVLTVEGVGYALTLVAIVVTASAHPAASENAGTEVVLMVNVERHLKERCFALLRESGATEVSEEVRA